MQVKVATEFLRNWRKHSPRRNTAGRFSILKLRAAAVAEFERGIICDRVNAGLAAAKA